MEDRVDRLARLVLVILLLATLGWVGQGRTPTQDATVKTGVPLVLVARPWQREDLVKRSERRAKAI